MAPRPGDDDTGELVFVSYSHADAAWVQRFAVLLKPLLRNRRLRLWVDTTLRGGDEWRPGIETAIARSAAALLLVSADFLGSDFVVDEELPALVRHGVRLLPVLVGDCLWDEEPTLAGVQWLHDPGRDGPLGRDAGDPSKRDERLVAVCRALVAALPRAADPRPPRPTLEEVTAASAPFVPEFGPVAAVPAGPSAGELSGVPEVPPGYVVRDELATLIEAVTSSEAGGAVGVTAQLTPLGLLGQGGIGKSVLAAALGRDDRIRHRFPDGVFWVTLGERADVLAAQLDLLERLGGGGPAPRAIHDATTRLREVLRERRVLLLVDDVWSGAAAFAFRVAGAQGRVVYTTRDRAVVAPVGAREHPVGVLSEGMARAVAAAVLGVSAEALPAAADRAFAEVGRVALAVALLAAAVRGGRSWNEVTHALRRDVDVWGDHPYANTFAAMQLAVAALPADLATALLGLAVFPPDTTVPVAAVARYWAHTRGPDVDVVGDLDRLAAGGVLRRDGDGIGFHDLQHDYLLLHSPGLPALHADLLEAYRVLLPHREWWQLAPDEPYVWDHLVAHLAGAGERRTLGDTVTDPAYLARRIGGGGVHGAEADLTAAAAVLPQHRLVAWWQRWLARHASFLAGSGAALAESTAPTMLAWLQADPTRSAEVDPARLGPVLPSPYLAVRWGLASPEPALVRALTGHRRAVRAVDWSPDGTLVAGGAEDGVVRLWDADIGRTVAMTRPGLRYVDKVTWSPDGREVAIIAASRLFLVDARGHAVDSPLDGLAAVRDVAWSPDGRLAVLDGLGLDNGNRLRLCHPDGARLDQLVVDDAGGVRVAWSADGVSLATADRHGVVEIWDAVVRRRTGAVRQFPRRVDALTWAPRSGTLAVASEGRIHLWRPGDDTVTLLGDDTHLVSAVAWSPTGDRLATGGRDVRVWDVAGGRSVALGSHTDLVGSVAWSPDGTRLASAGGDREVQIWGTTAAGPDAPPARPADGVHAVAVRRDGRHVATLGSNSWTMRFVLQIWDVAVGPLASASTPAGWPGTALVWSTDDRFIAIAGPRPRRWERATDRMTAVEEVVDHRSGSVHAFAWAPDGRRFACAYLTGSRVGSVDESGVITVLQHDGVPSVLSWSPDGTRLAGHGSEVTTPLGAAGEIVVWKIGDGRVWATLRHERHRSAVLGWSPDSSRLAVVPQGAPLVLWEPATGATTMLAGRVDSPTGVAWSPDGRHVITTSEDGAVVIQSVDGTSCTRLQLAGANCVAWEGSTIAVGQRTGPAVLELRTPGEPPPPAP